VIDMTIVVEAIPKETLNVFKKYAPEFVEDKK